MKKIFFSLFVCSFIIACKSGNKDETTTPQGDTSLSNLLNQPTITAPVNPASTDAPAVTSTAATENPNVTETLQQTWVIDTVNGKAIVPADFQFRTPVITFSLGKKTLEGHAGCNGIKGKISVQGKKISVSDLVSTKIACKNSN